ncbi:probable flap endonuclease 1 homolog isoform X1 [Xyrichtys novacula]|uniref:Probable flap endonuclease 1 homolog isoform X1 n=1 Tax=Xyrichtys novacula TaxID=13765 RepID=A0AAV1GE81_XYRNO|nr:probable flap endonuclease 1 homolog isoform X1 [Xyrichtys novacula]
MFQMLFLIRISVITPARKKIALDTSIVMMQFRAATSSQSPLIGLFFRTLTFLEHDIKPVFVFDGKPPREKTAVLVKRAEAGGWRVPRYTGTASSLTKDCHQLLKLMGVPVVQAPGDAEAFCAWLVREGKVDAVASEDMDTLPFGASILIRQLNAKRDSDVTEYSLDTLLKKLQIDHKEFVDLCILLGCDYCDKITGLGPKRALTLIQKHRTIEDVVKHVNRKTHPVPNAWKYKEAREIFLEEPGTEAPEFTWTELDEEALVRFLCDTGHAKKDRVRRRMERFHQTRESKREERAKDKEAGRSRQTLMEDFFRVTRKREKPVEIPDSLSINKKRQKTK